MDSQQFRIHTSDRLVSDITVEVAKFVAGYGDGLVNVFVPHATAGVGLMETGSGSEPDLAATIERLLPTADIYTHRHGSLGHGRDHVLPAFISASLSIPVIAGRLQLGTWQSVVLIDPNGDNPDRKVRLSFLRG